MAVTHDGKMLNSGRYWNMATKYGGIYIAKTKEFIHCPDYEWDYATDIAKCLWCGKQLRKTVKYLDVFVESCDNETCLAMVELRK